jgi:beta-lactamase class C
MLCFLTPSSLYAADTKTINSLAETFMAQNHVNGLSIAVIEKGKITIFNYGYADIATKRPITSQTIYPIASFTKSITATLAAIADADNKIALNNAFTDYIPELASNKNLDQMTINALLGHSASLPFDFNPPPQTYSEALNHLNHFVPAQPPETEYHYSNLSIGLVGYVLQNVYHEPYQTILEKNLLKPLDMHSTYLVVPSEKEKYITTGYDQDNHIVPYDKNLTVWFAAASLKSTISDMALFVKAQMDNNVLSNRELAKAITMVHKNKYCFEDGASCEQLAWQAHLLSQLKKNTEDSYFYLDKHQNPDFETKKLLENKTFSSQPFFVDKSCSGYGASGYMAYNPSQKTGVVILLNKSVGNKRIRLGRDILLSLS